MKEELSKREKLCEFMKEMWSRYKCYYKYEYDVNRKDCIASGESLGYYLKYSEEEIDAMRNTSLEDAHYLIDHWDEYDRLLEQRADRIFILRLVF